MAFVTTETATGGVIHLRAGRITAELDGPDIRSVKVDDLEVLRRVYVAVRDRNWDTVEPTIVTRDVTQDQDGFRIDIVVRHQRDDVGVEWTGLIEASDEGRLTIRVAGRAISSFLRRRIGLCVHHPIVGHAGRPCTVVHSDGRLEQTAFPLLVDPHQPFRDVRRLRYDIAPECSIELGFEGDEFETEDHRNWTDASFKTYATPMRDADPIPVRPGDGWVQAITLGVVSTRTTRRRPCTSDEPLSVALLAGTGQHLPALGVGTPADRHGHAATIGDRLRSAHLSHIRVDLGASTLDWEASLAHAWTMARAAGARLEVALELPDAAEAELARLVGIAVPLRPRVARWIVQRSGQRAPDPGLGLLARRYLASIDTDAAFGTGSNDAFVSLNRSRPNVAGLDFVSYGISPQVHAADDRTILENLEGQAWTVLTARSFTTAGVVVSPVLLRPTANPVATMPYPAAADAPPAWADPRQDSLLCAAWTLASIAGLARAGAAVATYHHASGWAGILPGADEAAGSVYPVYHALADVGEMRDGVVGTVHAGEPGMVDGLVVRAGGRLRALIANLADRKRVITVTGLGESSRVRVLDDASLSRATRDPVAYRADPGARCDAPGGRLTIELDAHAIARIDGDV